MSLSPVCGLSPLLASVTTAAVVATGVVADEPGSVMPSLVPAHADVLLAAVGERLDNPVTQLIETTRLAQTYLFATYYNGADAPTPGAGEANWPYAGLDQTGGDLLNYALHNSIELGYYSAVGVLPQILGAPFPALRQLAFNTFDNINTEFNAVLDAFSTLSDGVWNFPLELFNAAELAFNGQVQDAVTLLRNAIVQPITTALDQFTTVTRSVIDTMNARFVAVSKVLPAVLANIAVSVANSVELVLNQASAIGSTVAEDLSKGQFVDAVNVTVDGLLGPSGLPGTVLNTTIGPGLQTGPILALDADVKTNFTPSIRTAVQSGQWIVQNALTAQPAPVAAVSRTSAPPAAAGRSAVRVAAASAVPSRSPAHRSR